MNANVLAHNPFTARWSATGNNLCLGHWDIAFQGAPLRLPPSRRQHDMGTYAIYSALYPDEAMYAEGLREDDWILQQAPWLEPLLCQHSIPADEAHLRAFYRAVNAQDWRCGSCGGCL